MDIIKTIQKEIERSGKSRYQIGLETGLAESLLFRIYHGTTGISAKTAQTLLDYFGYELTKRSD
jgi:hypothetical protein